MTKPTKQIVTTFIFGGVATFLVSKFLKSKSARSLAVKGVAGGMKLKDCALEQVESIREEALDIYEEAKRLPEEV